jgi:hypothetical protein
MTTTNSGGKITGLLALTCTTDQALNIGDFVSVVGDYQVALATGAKPVLGHVSVKNVRRDLGTQTHGSTFPVADTPGGQVTVEARGLYVKEHAAGAAITAGAAVGIGAAGALLPVGAGVTPLGIALNGAAAAGVFIDVLVTAAA